MYITHIYVLLHPLHHSRGNVFLFIRSDVSKNLRFLFSINQSGEITVNTLGEGETVVLSDVMTTPARTRMDTIERDDLMISYLF